VTSLSSCASMPSSTPSSSSVSQASASGSSAPSSSKSTSSISSARSSAEDEGQDPGSGGLPEGVEYIPTRKKGKNPMKPVGVAWAIGLPSGIILFLLAKREVDKNRLEQLKIRRKMMEANQGEYESERYTRPCGTHGTDACSPCPACGVVMGLDGDK
uniref:Uncharacterized protein n=1 Tax=Buteo japonicus TaxID=224669 RepID=A0A8C0BWA4_9AVES